MDAVISFWTENWREVVLPVLVFVLSSIALFWLRKLAYNAFERWLSRRRWPAARMLSTVRWPSVFWCLVVAASLGVAVSEIPADWKSLIGKGLWTLLLVTVTISLLILARGLIHFYGLRLKMPWRGIVLVSNIARITIIIIAVLLLLDIWGVLVTPLLLLVLVAALAAVLAFRDAIPSVVAGFQMSAGQGIKEGDYIKLETGEEGYVLELGWRNTAIKGLDESTVTIPNSRLVQKTVVNYGHPLKRASEPFRFYTRTHLTELTGLKAKNLREMTDILKTVPESVVYYHTHRFLEVHHYLTPEPSNDFGTWVTDALGDQVLGERLSSIDTFAFPDLGSLRERLVGIAEEYLAGEPNHREAMAGREFYFMKSVSIILPTPYLVSDLREFVETLRKISLGCLYFHIFESRLRLGKGLNDFSTWLQDSLGENELGQEIARLDPYTYTLEGLRSALIRLVEKRIQ